MTLESDMNVSDEMLMALADGELTGPDATKLMARIKANPELARRYAVFTDTAQALREAMDAGPVPDHLIAAVLTVPAGERAEATDVRPLHPPKRAALRRATWPMALAASLTLAVGLGGFLGVRGSSQDMSGPEGAAMALAGTGTGGSVVLPEGETARVVGSFDTVAGLCRLIVVERAAGGDTRSVMCRTAGRDWITALSVTEAGGDLFLPASDLTTGLIDTYLDGIGAGAALSADDEAAALER